MLDIKHATQSVGPDATNGEIRQTQWNEAHRLTMASPGILGRTAAGQGPVQDIAIGAGLELSGAALVLAAGFKLLRVTSLTTSGTWTKSSDAVLFLVECIGGGGGGGAGAHTTAGGNFRNGGQGGGAGYITQAWAIAEEVQAACPYTIGAGGAGGTGVAQSLGGLGNAGGGTSITLADGFTVSATGGLLGRGGTGGSQTAQTALPAQFGNMTWAMPQTTHHPVEQRGYAPGMGGQGGYNAGDSVERPGGDGGSPAYFYYTLPGTDPVPNTGGTVAQGNADNAPTTTWPLLGQGGGGGASRWTTSAISDEGWRGGDGGAPGGGGGGGGARVTTATSSRGGPGGDGARGEIRIWEFG